MAWQPPEKCPDLVHALRTANQIDAADQYIEEVNRQTYFDLRHPFEKYYQDILDKECKVDGLPLGWEKANNADVYVDHFNRSVHKTQPQSDDEYRSRIPVASKLLPGWRRYIKNSDKGYGPRRLFYHHLSSKTFQWQNPQLLHSSLFQLSVKSLVDHQLPPQWDVRLLEQPQANGTMRYIPTFFHKENRYATFDDPRTTEAKVEMLRNHFKHNEQKNVQKLFLELDMFLNSIYAQLAWWSTEELHPHDVETQFANSPAQARGVTIQAIALAAQEFASPQLSMLVKRGFMNQCDIHPISGAFFHDDPLSWNVLKHFYVFGRFLGWALWMGEPIGLDLGPTIIWPLKGENKVPLKVIDGLELLDQDSGYTVFNGLRKFVQQGTQQRAIDAEVVCYSIGFKRPVPPDENNDNGDGPPQGRNLVYHLRADAQGDDSPMYTNDLRMFDDVLHRIEAFITRDSFGPQVQALKNGFKDVVPLEWARLFGARELATLIGGEPSFDQTIICKHFIWQWSANVNAAPEVKADFEKRFVDTLRTRLDSDTKDFAGNLLFYITSRRCAPLGGFQVEPPYLAVEDGSPIGQVIFWAQTCVRKLIINYTLYLELFEPLQGGMDLFIDELYNTVQSNTNQMNVA